MNNLGSISNAEWQVMRIIWTLKKCTSRQIIQIMNSKVQWKASTVKTLITRLKRKQFVGSHRMKRRNLYYPKINEQKAANLVSINLFRMICPMHAGLAINNLIQNLTISQTDVQKLIKTLKRIEPNAPKRVKCNCLVTKPKEDCKNEHDKNEREEN